MEVFFAKFPQPRFAFPLSKCQRNKESDICPSINQRTLLTSLRCFFSTPGIILRKNAYDADSRPEEKRGKNCERVSPQFLNIGRATLGVTQSERFKGAIRSASVSSSCASAAALCL